MRSSEAATTLVTMCSPAITAVTSCLDFATGRVAVPTPSCCNAVGSMKEKQPVCLCFFIGQAHNGSEQIKSLELLGISPSSPAAAIFIHNNATSPAGPISSSSSSTATSTDSKSSGFKHEYGLLGGILAVFVYAFLCSPFIQNL
ncbi:hypothetical protein KSS87_015551 [Heliosperma pusillum]|nr:hypothetical protein KSS87_015551 [Heliosperma pusillum]